MFSHMVLQNGSYGASVNDIKVVLYTVCYWWVFFFTFSSLLLVATY